MITSNQQPASPITLITLKCWLVSSLVAVAVVFALSPPRWPDMKLSTALTHQPAGWIGTFLFALSTLFLSMSFTAQPVSHFGLLGCVCWLGLLAFPSVAPIQLVHWLFSAGCLMAFAVHITGASRRGCQTLCALLVWLVLVLWAACSFLHTPLAIVSTAALDAVGSGTELSFCSLLWLWFLLKQRELSFAAQQLSSLPAPVSLPAPGSPSP